MRSRVTSGGAQESVLLSLLRSHPRPRTPRFSCESLQPLPSLPGLPLVSLLLSPSASCARPASVG
eukprot:5543482-Pleurochrysis_carterae.AAC.2